MGSAWVRECGAEEHRLRNQNSLVSNPRSFCDSGRMPLGKSLKCTGPQFPHPETLSQGCCEHAVKSTDTHKVLKIVLDGQSV